MREHARSDRNVQELFPLPCACQNLRRVSRIVTRIYDEELREVGLEITGFAMDSTTLTRTLALLREQGWVQVRRGEDRRERIFRLTTAGKRKMMQSQPHWERAEQRLKAKLGDAGWNNMRQAVSRMTEAAIQA